MLMLVVKSWLSSGYYLSHIIIEEGRGLGIDLKQALFTKEVLTKEVLTKERVTNRAPEVVLFKCDSMR